MALFNKKGRHATASQQPIEKPQTTPALEDQLVEVDRDAAEAGAKAAIEETEAVKAARVRRRAAVAAKEQEDSRHPIVPAGHPAEHLLEKEVLAELKRRLQTSVANKVATLAGDPSYDKVRSLISDTVDAAVRRAGNDIASTLDDDDRAMLADYLTEYLTSEFLGYGPIDKLLADPAITEIMVNPLGLDPVTGEVIGHEVYVEQGGRMIKRPDVRFEDDAHVRRIMTRIAGRCGRLLDEMHPEADATLYDGSRFHGAISPACPDGSMFDIRTFSDASMDVEDLAAAGAMTHAIAEFLATAIEGKCNILISGGTGAGKTTLLNALSRKIPSGERLLVLEDTSELKVTIGRPNSVRFVSRPPNAEGAGEITMKDLVASALRCRPDRIIIGEVRGSEAEDMLEAMNTGHEGSMTTIHANTPTGALNRLVTLVRQGNAELSENLIMEKIAEALDLVVQIQRLPNGDRRVMEVSCVGGYTDGHIQLEPLFRYDRRSGEHSPCGTQPKDLARKLSQRGFDLDIKWFMPAPGKSRTATA